MRHHMMALFLGVLALGSLPSAEAQAPTIVGTWKLNVEASDDTEEMLQLAMRGETAPETGRGMGRTRRPPSGGGSVAGGGGAPSGGGGTAGGASGPMRRVVRPPAQLIVEMSDSMIVIRDGGEIPQKIYLDGRTVQEPALTGPPVELTAKWKDGKLSVERKIGELDTMRETYSFDKKNNRLIVEAKVTSTTFQRPLELKRVYDPAS
jgi:hypothetical protein